MNANDLQDLEHQVTHLINSITQLRSENSALRKQLNSLTRERGRLIEANQQASDKVQRIIRQLKEEIA